MRLFIPLIGATAVVLCSCARKPSTPASVADELRINPPAVLLHSELGHQPLVDPAIIRADFDKVRIGMVRKEVHSILGRSLVTLRQPRPVAFPGRLLPFYDGPTDPNVTYVLEESYYPAPPLKRTIDSPYMFQGFIVYYDEADRVVHKKLHPDLR